jgi:hypothetical protein
MNPFVQRLLNVLRPLGIAGGIATGLGLLAVVAVVWSLALLADAAVTPSKVDEPPEAQQQERLSKYEAALDKRAAQAEGRSMFIPPVAPNKPVEEEKPDDKPPPPPATYGGPGLVAIVYDRVWFDDGRSMLAGEAEDSGLAVVDVSPPWAARLRWRGVEFDVTLFSRTTASFLMPEDKGEDKPESTGGSEK